MSSGGLRPAPGPLALVQEFINTRNIMRGRDLLDRPEGAAAWLEEHGLLGGEAVSEAGWRRLVGVRERLRLLLLAHNGSAGAVESALEVLNGLVRPASLRVRFDPGGDPRLEPAVGGVDGALGRILAIVIRAAAEGDWRRLKACREKGCRWVFYDNSRNRSGAWCTMEVCGSRAKMRSYRRRRADKRNR